MQSWKRILPSLPNHTERYPSAEEHSPVVLTSATPNGRSVSAHANFVECNALKPKYKDTARSAYTWRSILRGSRKFESQITTHIDAVFPRSISQMEPNYTQSHSSRGQVASESDCFAHHHPSHTDSPLSASVSQSLKKLATHNVLTRLPFSSGYEEKPI